jgi:hypothetical protein
MLARAYDAKRHDAQEGEAAGLEFQAANHADMTLD